jgi:hypothetical protein
LTSPEKQGRIHLKENEFIQKRFADVRFRHLYALDDATKVCRVAFVQASICTPASHGSHQHVRRKMRHLSISNGYCETRMKQAIVMASSRKIGLVCASDFPLLLAVQEWAYPSAAGKESTQIRGALWYQTTR